jgi:hypothetical protein
MKNRNNEIAHEQLIGNEQLIGAQACNVVKALCHYI